VTTLSHYQSYQCIQYVAEIIMHLIQQHWLFLPTWQTSLYLCHIGQSKWKSAILDVMSQVIDTQCKVSLAHSNIRTVCDKGKGTAIFVLACCGPERVTGCWGSQIFRHLPWRWSGCLPYVLSIRKCSWYSFLIVAELTPGPFCSLLDCVSEKF
jgi:hypothetical protein